MRFMIFSLFFSDLIVFAAKCMLNRFTNASNLVAFCLFVFFFSLQFSFKTIKLFYRAFNCRKECHACIRSNAMQYIKLEAKKTEKRLLKNQLIVARMKAINKNNHDLHCYQLFVIGMRDLCCALKP